MTKEEAIANYNNGGTFKSVYTVEYENGAKRITTRIEKTGTRPRNTETWYMNGKKVTGFDRYELSNEIDENNFEYTYKTEFK